MTVTLPDVDLGLLDFPVEEIPCENEFCAFGHGPVRYRMWFEPYCRCGTSLVCWPCGVAMRAMGEEPCPFMCRDCHKAYPVGQVRDYLRVEPLPA